MPLLKANPVDLVWGLTQQKKSGYTFLATDDKLSSVQAIVAEHYCPFEFSIKNLDFIAAQRFGSAAAAGPARLLPNYRTVSRKSHLRERQSRCPLEPVLGVMLA